jgi:single-strand DNA-binding protein
MSTLTIAGNLTRDPELRNVNGGRTVVSFSIAENRRWADKATGTTQEAVTYLDVTAWGAMADHVTTSLHTGDGVLVTGRLEQRSWERTDGGRHTKHELVATEVAASLRYAEASLTRAARPAPGEDDDPN